VVLGAEVSLPIDDAASLAGLGAVLELGGALVDGSGRADEEQAIAAMDASPTNSRPVQMG